MSDRRTVSTVATACPPRLRGALCASALMACLIAPGAWAQGLSAPGMSAPAPDSRGLSSGTGSSRYGLSSPGGPSLGVTLPGAGSSGMGALPQAPTAEPPRSGASAGTPARRGMPSSHSPAPASTR